MVGFATDRTVVQSSAVALPISVTRSLGAVVVRALWQLTLICVPPSVGIWVTMRADLGDYEFCPRKIVFRASRQTHDVNACGGKPAKDGQLCEDTYRTVET
jgi:hypothetical protein